MARHYESTTMATDEFCEEAITQPFIKWVGGKRALAKEILNKAKIGHKFRFVRYLEPFVGGGAMFFHLVSNGYIKPGTSKVHLSDVNGPLIETYRAIQLELPELMTLLKRHEDNHAKTGAELVAAIANMAAITSSIVGVGGSQLSASKPSKATDDYYYWVRDCLYNRIKQDYDLPEVRVHLAAAFLYLNRTGFNGMYRENASGGMNIPKGRYANPAIVNAKVLKAASAALQGIDLRCRSYLSAIAEAGKGDLVYLDPPYFETFTDYSKGGFDGEQQECMAELAAMAADWGASVIISNSDTSHIEKIYRSHDFEVARIQAARNINSDGAGRSKVSEIVAFRINNR